MGADEAPIHVKWSADDLARVINMIEQGGYRKAIADLRDVSAYSWWASHQRHVDEYQPFKVDPKSLACVADFLESRLTKEQS